MFRVAGFKIGTVGNRNHTYISFRPKYYQILALVVLSYFGFITIWYYLVLSVFCIGTIWYFVVLTNFGIGTIWYYMVLSDFGMGIL